MSTDPLPSERGSPPAPAHPPAIPGVITKDWAKNEEMPSTAITLSEDDDSLPSLEELLNGGRRDNDTADHVLGHALNGRQARILKKGSGASSTAQLNVCTATEVRGSGHKDDPITFDEADSHYKLPALEGTDPNAPYYVQDTPGGEQERLVEVADASESATEVVSTPSCFGSQVNSPQNESVEEVASHLGFNPIGSLTSITGNAVGSVNSDYLDTNAATTPWPHKAPEVASPRSCFGSQGDFSARQHESVEPGPSHRSPIDPNTTNGDASSLNPHDADESQTPAAAAPSLGRQSRKRSRPAPETSPPQDANPRPKRLHTRHIRTASPVPLESGHQDGWPVIGLSGITLASNGDTTCNLAWRETRISETAIKDENLLKLFKRQFIVEHGEDKWREWVGKKQPRVRRFGQLDEQP